MKLKISILIFALFIFLRLEAQEKYILTRDYKDLSFEEFVQQAENEFHLRFFYKPEWVAGLKLSEYNDCKTIQCVLDNLFRGRDIFYYIDETGNVVITKDFAVKIREVTGEAEADQNYIPPSGQFDNDEDQQKIENRYVELGNRSEKDLPGKVVVTGYVRNTETGEAVAGVTVYIQKLSMGAVTNNYGFYTLTLPRGTYDVVYSFIGMKEKKISLNLYGPGELDIEMNNMLIPLNETVVSARKSTMLRRFETGVEKINVSSFKLLPASLGEADLMKSILLIPGVQSSGEGSAGFNVRGGSADQNLILMDGAPVYNSSHFFGFFSAVNTDIIKDATLYKGGIPSRYGGRISSVLDIALQEGSGDKFTTGAGISPIAAHFSAAGPVIKDTLTYVITGRTTYSNWIFKVFDNPYLNNCAASFYDLNAKITYRLNKNNKLGLSSYVSHDSFRLDSTTLYGYNNNIVALKWQHFFTSRFISLFSVNNSFYKYDITNQDIPAEAYIMSHKINSTQFRADFNWFSGRHEINFGLDMSKYSLVPGSYVPADTASLVIPHQIDPEKALETSLYVDDKFTLTDFLSVNFGMRFSSYFTFGPHDVLIYNPGFAKGRTTVIDTLSFRPGEIIRRYGGPELRFSVNFRLSESNSLKLNYNRTRQYIHLLSNTASISPTDTWKLCDYYIKPETGDQFAIGFYQMLFRNGLETSAEVYYKSIKNMVDFKGGSTLTMDENIEQNIINVEGKAYGLELALKKTEGKYRYTIGYTWSRSLNRSTGIFKDETINKGNWYPSNYDKPNDLVLTFDYLHSRRLSFSSSYTYSTGRPITYPISAFRMNDIFLVNYSDRNKYRIPDYSRLDVSVKINGNLRVHKYGNPYLTLSVYNLFGKENAYSVFFKKKADYVTGYKLSVFGRPIPSVTFGFDF